MTLQPFRKVLDPIYRVLVRTRAALRPLPLVQFRRLGTEYGGGWVAVSLLDAGSVVYSVGVGEEISFDEQLAALTGCTIVGFDPTPRAAQYVARHAALPPKYSFVPVGIAAESGARRFYFPKDPAHVSMSLVHDSSAGHIDCDFLTLEDVLKRQGHEYVDLIKLDVEGEEYRLLEDWLARGYRPPVGQLWVEFHPGRAAKPGDCALSLARRMVDLGFLPFHDGANGVLFLSTRHHPLVMSLPTKRAGVLLTEQQPQP